MKFKSFARSFFYVLLCTLFLSSNVFSQQKSQYNLLWEITGNGLTKPSYLFGSIHIKDKRVFNFSDSVMKAIEASSAFALEVHPDTMLKAIFNKISENKELPKSPLKNDYKKDDDMQTFIDAYLYGIARTHKKKVFGLEKAEAQMDLLYGNDADDLFGDGAEEERQSMEEMIGLYIKGDINGIWTYIKDKDLERVSLTERNRVMAKSITDILKTETLFATVGVAHMPGEEGVIALLQHDGYTMRAVEGAFTGIAATYKIDYAKMDWYTFQNETEHYSVDFPSAPFFQQSGGTKIAAFPDMINNVLYSATSLYVGPILSATDEVYLDSLVNNFLKDSTELLSRKKVVKYGAPGVEILFKKRGKFVRMLWLYKNKTNYNLAVENEKNNLNEDFAERFFNSLKIKEPEVVSQEQWVDFKNTEGAFSIKMPYQPESMHQEVANTAFPGYPPYFLNMYSAVDKFNMVNYLVRYNDFPNGMYLSDKSVTFKEFIRGIESKGKLLGEPTVIFNNGFEGRSLSVNIQGMLMEIRMFLRGNRTYVLLRQNMKETESLKSDPFFDSFKLEKYAFNKGIPTTIGSITVDMPQKPVLIPEENDSDESTSIFKNRTSHYSVNKNSGGLYGFEQANISKYYRTTNLDSLYTLILKGFEGAKDSMYHAEDVMMAGIPTKQCRFYSAMSGNYRLIRVWIYNNQLYCGSVIGDKEELESSQWSDLFKNIKYIEKSNGFDLATSKVDLIMKDLKSTDTLIYKDALGAIGFYEFTKDELPQIYTALKFKYANDTLSGGARNVLIRNLTDLHDDKAVPLLKDLFKDEKNAELIRVNALSKLSEIDKNSYDWYLNSLLTSKPFDSDLHWRLFKPLKDSLSFAVKHIDQLVKLMEYKTYRPELLNVIYNMLAGDNKVDYITAVKGLKERIMGNAMVDVENELRKLNGPDEVDYGMIYSYLNLIPQLDMTELTDKITKKIFAVDSIVYLKNAALVGRIVAGLKLDQQLLNAHLDSLGTRYQLMDAFNNVGKIDEVPLKYRKHDEFAKVLLYNYLDDEYGPSDSIRLLGEVKEGAEIYYVFEFVYDDDEGAKSNYIGVVGAFDNQSDKLNFEDYSCHSNFDKKAEDWISQAKALVKELKENE